MRIKKLQITPGRLVAVLAACLLVGSVTCMLGKFFPGSITSSSVAAEGAEEMMLAHNVYFSLKDSTPANREALVAACHKYLSAHEGTVFYAAGPLAEEFTRDVNDRAWDVGLHVIFKTKADHDKYQDHPLHLKFIEENKATWKGVRVFDSYVSTPHK